MHKLLNRELSWLDFNERVLAQAREHGVPLLERLKFVAITASNLDEFFQVRVAALDGQVEAGVTDIGVDGRTPAETLAQVRPQIGRLIEAQDSLLRDELMPQLAAHGLPVRSWAQLGDDDRKPLVAYFDERVYALLTPLAVDPGHPFPYISNLALNVGVYVVDRVSGERRFARVKLPAFLPRFLPVDSGGFVALEEVVGSQLPSLFPGMDVQDWWPFRVTRDADLDLAEDEADDLLEAIEIELRRRRFGRAVRLEVPVSISEEMLDTFVEELQLSNDEVTFHRSPLDLTGLWSIHAAGPASLRDDVWPASAPSALTDRTRSIFAVIRENDVLLHHPYDSFSSVESFVAAAADDPLVRSIKMTLYRTSGDSPIARSLIRAAERGVQVAVLIELKARFDEQANVNWAREMEAAGVHVVYGLVGLKTHAKCVLVVREEPRGLRRYVHLGTGNYNSRTSRVYEDLGLLTADPEIAADAGELFNHLTGFSQPRDYRSMVVAPRTLRDRVCELIRHEIQFGEDGRVTAKMNGLADPTVINALYEAASAGVRIDMIVRGVCTLRAGVTGLSETIAVRSVLGRYLEHSRILRFDHGGPNSRPITFIGSADLMPRNLDRRVEVLVPVADPAHARSIDGLLGHLLADDIVRWELGPDDNWFRQGPQLDGDVQARIRREAKNRLVPSGLGA